MSIRQENHELSDMSTGKAPELDVQNVSEEFDREDLDREQLAKLGKKSVLKVRFSVIPHCHDSIDIDIGSETSAF